MAKQTVSVTFSGYVNYTFTGTHDEVCKEMRKVKANKEALYFAECPDLKKLTQKSALAYRKGMMSRWHASAHWQEYEREKRKIQEMTKSLNEKYSLTITITSNKN